MNVKEEKEEVGEETEGRDGVEWKAENRKTGSDRCKERTERDREREGKCKVHFSSWLMSVTVISLSDKVL